MPLDEELVVSSHPANGDFGCQPSIQNDPIVPQATIDDDAVGDVNRVGIEIESLSKSIRSVRKGTDCHPSTS